MAFHLVVDQIGSVVVAAVEDSTIAKEMDGKTVSVSDFDHMVDKEV